MHWGTRYPILTQVAKLHLLLWQLLLGLIGMTSGAYGAFIGGGSLSEMAIAGGIGFLGGAVTGVAALVGQAGFVGTALLNFGVNAELNLVGQGIAYNRADSCKKPMLNGGAALASGLGSMVGGVLGRSLVTVSEH
jgi:hypothetical protein